MSDSGTQSVITSPRLWVGPSGLVCCPTAGRLLWQSFPHLLWEPTSGKETIGCSQTRFKGPALHCHGFPKGPCSLRLCHRVLLPLRQSLTKCWLLRDTLEAVSHFLLALSNYVKLSTSPNSVLCDRGVASPILPPGCHSASVCTWHLGFYLWGVCCVHCITQPYFPLLSSLWATHFGVSPSLCPQTADTLSWRNKVTSTHCSAILQEFFSWGSFVLSFVFLAAEYEVLGETVGAIPVPHSVCSQDVEGNHRDTFISWEYGTTIWKPECEDPLDLSLSGRDVAWVNLIWPLNFVIWLKTHYAGLFM